MRHTDGRRTDLAYKGQTYQVLTPRADQSWVLERDSSRAGCRWLLEFGLQMRWSKSSADGIGVWTSFAIELLISNTNKRLSNWFVFCIRIYSTGKRREHCLLDPGNEKCFGGPQREPCACRIGIQQSRTRNNNNNVGEDGISAPVVCCLIRHDASGADHDNPSRECIWIYGSPSWSSVRKCWHLHQVCCCTGTAEHDIR